MSRYRPVLLLVVASLIPVVVLAAIMGRFFIREQQASLDAQLRLQAATFASSLQRELDAQIKLLTIVAESPRLDPPISRPAFNELARRLRERIVEWEQVRVSDGDGNVVLSVPALRNDQRKVVEMSSHDLVFREGVATVGSIALGSSGKAAFALRVPIERKDKVRAVLSAVVRPTIITDLLLNAGLPSNWTWWVVDQQNRLVSSTGNPALAGGEADAFATFSGQDLGFGQLKDGSELRVAETTLSSTPWKVRVALPIDEFEALSHKATLLLIIASAFTLLLSAIAIYLFLREARARSMERETMANWQRMDALGKLTGQAAHDFNNLLMVFQSGVEGLKRRRHDEQRVTQLLDHMADGVARGKMITQRLLSFSRRSNQGAERIDLDLKLPDMMPLLRQAANDTISITLDVTPDAWSVHADPLALEIALINLVTNAREAMEGGGNITISATNIADGKIHDPQLRGEFVAISISDTGAGIAGEHLNRVFEPFFSGRPGKAGLGLTQVHSFAKGHDGAVKVSSMPGRGTAFTILLPRSREARPSQEISQPSELRLPHGVLIVDDTVSSLESARFALDGLVPKLLTASSGEEALDLIRQNPDIAAVLSDIMMPGMSGIELAARIAVLNSGMPVVLMTGYSDKFEEGTDLGRPVVAKPFKIEDLANAFRVAASQKRASNVVSIGTFSRSNET